LATGDWENIDTVLPDKEKTPRERLYDKMSDEYDGFLAELKTKPAQEIIEASYEKVFKEDLLLTVANEMDSNSFDDAKANALLALDSPLAHLYSCWLDTDVSYMDILRDCVDSEAVFLLLEQIKACEIPEQTHSDRESQDSKQPYTLLGDLRQTTAEVNARKAEKAAAPKQTKTKKQEESL
jgi:hypothetical protein